MIRDSVINNDTAHNDTIPKALTTQLVLAIATSIDALAVGISMACTGYETFRSLMLPLAVIGIGSFLFSIAGNMLGIRFGASVCRKVNPELFGGIVLVFIGVKVLLSHILN